MILSKDNLPVFIYESEAYSGVKKIADYVQRDMSLVFDSMPEKLEISGGSLTGSDLTSYSMGTVVFGTYGNSPVIDNLISENIISADDIRGKREVFLINIVDQSIIIAGSDKRGTIYGLFYLSKLLGVSPFVDWSDLKPAKRDSVELTDKVNIISKEPAVRYRGFFINDEWPAFGNFAMKRFGGVNAKLYEVIFTMLLRMNGNYLWPAMWASCFVLDGPGLESAELADELGVVMGMSHHEPCLRHGEEYSHVRGKDSIYGDAWNFKTNREGITRFWRDGLKRNGHLENVITIGMRGERDSTIMGEDATLADNIELLRDVIKTQNELIKEEVNPDLKEVPRLFALYKEVEPFYFGDKDTPGLIEDDCLDDVILLLCDDNHGYLRSRPGQPSEISERKKYGLYYHFDYHGAPISYEWVNSTYLPEVWEELTEAYETGIRDLFIVNVGDVGFNEFALNYFLDLAYDYDKWGINNVNSTSQYTKQWFEDNFAYAFADHDDYLKLADTWTQACRLNHRRRPEHMNENVYPATDLIGMYDILSKTGDIISAIDVLEHKCKINRDAFIELISFQTKASMNLIRMWIYKSYNAFSAKRSMYITNFLADRLEETFDADRKLTEWVHSINNGKYYGLALASHIGFKHWNDEESAYPSVEHIRLFDRKCIVAGVEGSNDFTTGQFWSKKRLHIKDISKNSFYLALCGNLPTSYKIMCNDENIVLSETEHVLTPENSVKIITIGLHNSTPASDTAINPTSDPAMSPSSSTPEPSSSHPKDETVNSVIHILYEDSDIEIEVNISNDDTIKFDSADYTDKFEYGSERLITISDLGNTNNGIKLYESDEEGKLCGYSNRPLDYSNINSHFGELSYLSYKLNVSEDGIYKIHFKFLPCSPRIAGENIVFGYQINNSYIRTENALSPMYQPGHSKDWAEGVITHEKTVSCYAELKEGRNTILYYPFQAENILLSITLTKVMSVQ